MIASFYNMTLRSMRGKGDESCTCGPQGIFVTTQLAVCNEHAICHALQAMCAEKKKEYGGGDRGGHCPARGSAPGELWKWR